MQDASKIKEKIISLIEQNGPSLPVRIASELNLSPLFSSAFLSELLSEKKIKISYMRVGNSPLYFIAGQEPKLENFSEHLKSKEKDAFFLLKKNNFLKDIEQDPAIRVALRAIKDFAILFEKNSEAVWRYFTIPEAEFIKKEEPKIIEKITEEIKEKIEPVKKIKKEILQKKKTVKKTAKKNNEKLFNKVKEFLDEKSIEIISVEGVSQEDITLKVKENGNEKIIVAYDKKKISEDEIIKANKKAQELGLNYTILSFGEPAKKMQSLIEAIKNLSKIEKLK
jgi:hypothetical protein